MKTGTTAYKSAVGLALATAFILVWTILAVGALGRAGDLADLMYIGVLAVGIIGAIIARFRPHGMARALFATALAQALVAVIALMLALSPCASSSSGVPYPCNSTKWFSPDAPASRSSSLGGGRRTGRLTAPFSLHETPGPWWPRVPRSPRS